MLDTFAMRMTEMGKKASEKSAMRLRTLAQEQQLQKEQAQQLQKERESKYQPGKYFIYEQGTSNGILVDVAMVKENCKSIKLMVEDLETEPNEIPLDVPVGVIKLVFGILDNSVDVKNLSATELVDVANIFNFLD